MFLTLRPMEPDDFGICRGLILDKHVYDAETYACIPQLWSALRRNGEIETAVVEDQECLPARRTVGFITIVFLTDAFVQELQSPAFTPYVNAQITRRWMLGASPLLTTEQVRKANGADGLNLLFFHIGVIPNQERTCEPHLLCQKMLYVAFEFARGYHVRKLFVDAMTPHQLRMFLNAGFQRQHAAAPHSQDQLPCLLTASRERPMEGSLLGSCFLHQQPRLHFKDGEQHLLRRAVLGEADEEIARALDVSVSTIHKRWLTIYGRATHVFPDLFPNPEGARGETDLKRRGLEKRRHLLTYIQSHHEELRPYPHPVVSQKARAAPDTRQFHPLDGPMRAGPEPSVSRS